MNRAREQVARSRLLIIEDDQAVSQMLSLLLEDPGVEILHAPDGGSGLTLSRTEMPDVILVDLVLPDIHGLEIVERVRQMPGHESTPIIVITANSTVENVREAALKGATDFLVKANVLCGTGLDRIHRHLATLRAP